MPKCCATLLCRACVDLTTCSSTLFVNCEQVAKDTVEKILCRPPISQRSHVGNLHRTIKQGKGRSSKRKETTGVPSFLPRGGRRDAPAVRRRRIPPAESQRKTLRPLGTNTLTQFVHPGFPVKKEPPARANTLTQFAYPSHPVPRMPDRSAVLGKVKTPFQTEQGFVLRFICVQELALRDSAYRAGTCAGTAIYTCVSVDLVLAVALSDSANRALASARAAHNAAATDNICHWYCTSKCILQLSFYHKI